MIFRAYRLVNRTYIESSCKVLILHEPCCRIARSNKIFVRFGHIVILRFKEAYIVICISAGIVYHIKSYTDNFAIPLREKSEVNLEDVPTEFIEIIIRNRCRNAIIRTEISNTLRLIEYFKGTLCGWCVVFCFYSYSDFCIPICIDVYRVIITHITVVA